MFRFYTRLQSIALILFLSLFAILSFNSRLATDDYYFIWDVQTHGVFASVYSQYMEWCGRYSATLAMDWMYLLGVNQQWYLFIPFLSFLILFLGVFKIFKALSSKYKFEFSTFILLFLSLDFSALLYFLSFDYGETWFWYCSLSSYLWSIIAFVWLIVGLISESSNVLLYLLLMLLAVYLGGSSEVYSVFYAIVFASILWFQRKKWNSLNDLFKDVLAKKVVFVSIVFTIAFLIFFFAPGNFVRDNLFPDRSLLNTLLITVKSIAKIAFFYLPNKLLYIVCFLPPFFIEGFNYGKKYLFKDSFRSFLLRITLYFLVVAFILLIIICYVMVETGPPRIMFIFSFLFCIYLVFIAFRFGQSCSTKERKMNVMLWSVGLLSVIYMAFHLIIQSELAFDYSSAVDQRIEQLLELKKEYKNIPLVRKRPLPPSGMLYSAEISSDTLHFTNKELKLGLELPFQVVKEEP